MARKAPPTFTRGRHSSARTGRAATAREDLENYEKSDPEEPETDIRKSRGGRSLDF